MNYKFQNFSVIVPVHNEELILEDSAIKIQSFCLKTNLDFEIIFLKMVQQIIQKTYLKIYQKNTLI